MQEIINEELYDDVGDKYIIHIDNFEGPLDLLWNLIKKSKIDIIDVSLSQITEQYLKYLQLMERMNIHIASTFILMASQLVFYKSRSLLPAGEIEDEYFVPPLPPELIQKLLEYKKYQLLTVEFDKMIQMQSDIFIRNNIITDINEEEYVELSLFDLLNAFTNVINKGELVEDEEIVFDDILVSDRINHILELLNGKEQILFEEIFSMKPRLFEVIVSFLAILEMTKGGLIKLLQHTVFGDIVIFRKVLDDIQSQ